MPRTAPNLYTKAWKRASKRYLEANPMCALCRRARALHTDHITPHEGDRRLFWNRNNWQGLCIPCHNAKTRRDETGKAMSGNSADGMPIDPTHHWNATVAHSTHSLRGMGVGGGVASFSGRTGPTGLELTCAKLWDFIDGLNQSLTFISTIRSLINERFFVAKHQRGNNPAARKPLWPRNEEGSPQLS